MLPLDKIEDYKLDIRSTEFTFHYVVGYGIIG